MTARKHHYVPRFLVAGFTETGTAEGVLHVTNLRDGRTWKSTPKGAGHQRDYYRVDMPGLEPDAFETELAKIEANASDVIRKAVASLEVPQGEELVASDLRPSSPRQLAFTPSI